MGQVDLAAGRRDGGAGLAQPVEHPSRVEDRGGRQQPGTGGSPPGKHLPAPRQDHGDRERQHQLRLHQGQAEREAGEIRPRP